MLKGLSDCFFPIFHYLKKFHQSFAVVIVVVVYKVVSIVVIALEVDIVLLNIKKYLSGSTVFESTNNKIHQHSSKNYI